MKIYDKKNNIERAANGITSSILIIQENNNKYVFIILKKDFLY